VYDIVSDITGNRFLFRSLVLLGFVKGMYVINELIIKVWYVNTLKLKWLIIVYLSTNLQ
jgi:hypothetical protein